MQKSFQVLTAQSKDYLYFPPHSTVNYFAEPSSFLRLKAVFFASRDVTIAAEVSQAVVDLNIEVK